MGILDINWYPVASAIFAFATPKTVVISDLRLGILLRVLQVLVISYTLYDVLTKGSYLVVETPTGIVTPRADDTESFKNLNLDNALGFPYCKNSTNYWFVRDDESSTFIRCTYQRGGMWRRQSATISFNTYIMEDKLWYVRSPSAASCDRDGSRWLKDATYNQVRYAAGSCIYRRTRNWFPVATEQLQMGFWHSFATSRVNAYGSLPRTVIRRKGSDKNLVEFKQGQQPVLSVGRWLQMAGVDLDKRLDEQPFLKGHKDIESLVPPTLRGSLSNSQGQAINKTDYPYARLSGVQLVMNVRYYNYHMWPGTKPNTPKTKKGEVLCVVEISPVLSYAGVGSTIHYLMDSLQQPNFMALDDAARTPALRNKNDSTVDFASTELEANGVIFQFVTGGSLGKFSFSNLLSIFTRAAVLLSIAHTITLYVAKFALGTVSSLYNEFTTEKCNYRREYARFAVQAIVAGSLFLGMDKDNTGCLDKSEMFHSLQQMLGKALNEEEVGKLTDFLLRHGDEDENTDKRNVDGEEGLESNNKISLVEWIDIFTEDKANVKALQRILQSEYKNVNMGASCQDMFSQILHPVKPIKARTGEAPTVEMRDVENAKAWEEAKDDISHDTTTQPADQPNGTQLPKDPR